MNTHRSPRSLLALLISTAAACSACSGTMTQNPRVMERGDVVVQAGGQIGLVLARPEARVSAGVARGLDVSVHAAGIPGHVPVGALSVDDEGNERRERKWLNWSAGLGVGYGQTFGEKESWKISADAVLEQYEQFSDLGGDGPSNAPREWLRAERLDISGAYATGYGRRDSIFYVGPQLQFICQSDKTQYEMRSPETQLEPLYIAAGGVMLGTRVHLNGAVYAQFEGAAHLPFGFASTGRGHGDSAISAVSPMQLSANLVFESK